MYHFQTKFRFDELVKYLSINTHKLSIIDFEYGIGSSINGRKIKLQASTYMKNPLQRIFLGKITDSNTGTIIIGKFTYPLIRLVLFMLFLICMIEKNIEAIITLNELKDKIIVSLIFTVIYLGIIFIIWSGKFLYKKQEADVVKFLELLER